MRQGLERAEAMAVDAVVQGIEGLCGIGVGLDAPRRPDHGLDRFVDARVDARQCTRQDGAAEERRFGRLAYYNLCVNLHAIAQSEI